MNQTLKAGIVRFNRPVLIGGSAILGVATSSLINHATVKSALLATGALCLMYVGDVGRAVSDRVARLLPSEASAELVRSTQAHNLGSKGRANAIVLTAAVGLACLMGALIVSIAGGPRETLPKSPPLAIRAPRVYAVGSGTLNSSMGCPSSCLATLYIGAPRLTKIFSLRVPQGHATIRLLEHGLVAGGAQRQHPTRLKIQLASPGWAPVNTQIRLIQSHPNTISPGHP